MDLTQIQDLMILPVFLTILMRKEPRKAIEFIPSMTYVIIIVVAVVVICVLIVLGALHYKKKLPAFGGAGKNFKPVDQNETAQSGEGAVAAAADDPEEEAKHPSIVKANGSSNGVSPTKASTG